jgi:hypothetical protein
MAPFGLSINGAGRGSGMLPRVIFAVLILTLLAALVATDPDTNESEPPRA